MTTSVVASPTSAPAKAPSAPASAPAAAPSSAPATPTQGAAKPTPAPSKPQNVVKNSIGRVDRRGANDPMKAALERAKAAPAPQFETTGDGGNEPVAATPAQPTPQVSPADRAKAALSTTGKPGEQPPAQPTGEAAPTNPQSQAPDPARELESLRRSNSDFGRKLQNMNQELAEHRERKATADKEAEAAKLKPYMSGHPEHQASIGRMAKADAFDAALRSATAEQQSDPAYRSKLAREMKVTNADITLRDDWNAHREDHQSRMASDPDYFRKEVDKHSEAAAERVWERKSQEQRIRQDVTRDLADPEVRSFAKANPADFQRVLEATGHNTEWAAHHIKLFTAYNAQQARIEELESRIGDSDAKAGMATEQQRLLKARTTVAREPVAKTVGDPLKAAKAWAVENGVTPSMSHPRFRAKLSELHAAKSNPGNA